MTNIEEAKKIFNKYNGSHFHMMREGEYEEYKKFNISKEQELIWIKESIYESIKNLDISLNFNQYVNSLSKICSQIVQYNELHCFMQLFDKVSSNWIYKDSFSKLRMIEEIFNTIFSLKNQNQIQNEFNNIITILKDILKNIIENKITIDSSYLKLGYLDDMLNEATIKDRAKKLYNTIS